MFARMSDRYAIDVPGFMSLSARTARSLDDLTDAVSAAVRSLWAVRDAVDSVPDLTQAFRRAMDPWEAKAWGLLEYGGAVLMAAERAVSEYRRADVAMAVSTAQIEARQGTGRWRIA